MAGSQSHPRHYASIILSVQRHQLHLSSSLSNAIDPNFVDSLSSTPRDTSTLYDQVFILPCPFFDLPTKRFRSLIPLPPAIARSTVSSHPVPIKTWKNFWSWKLPHSVRNVWYRFFHRSLPTLVNLHHRIPRVFTSPLCRLCSVNMDNDLHFLLLCPLKLQLWKPFFEEFFICPTTTQELSIIFNTIMTSLAFPDLRHPFCSSLQPYQVFNCGLLCIWQAQWRYVFDNHHMNRGEMLTSCYKSIMKLMHTQLLPSLTHEAQSL